MLIPGQSIPIQFNVAVSSEAYDEQLDTNTALVQDSSGNEYSLETLVKVVIPPTIIATSPGDGVADVPITSTIMITFSK